MSDEDWRFFIAVHEPDMLGVARSVLPLLALLFANPAIGELVTSVADVASCFDHDGAFCVFTLRSSVDESANRERCF